MVLLKICLFLVTSKPANHEVTYMYLRQILYLILLLCTVKLHSEERAVLQLRTSGWQGYIPLLFLAKVRNDQLWPIVKFIYLKDTVGAQTSLRMQKKIETWSRWITAAENHYAIIINPCNVQIFVDCSLPVLYVHWLE